MKNSETTKVNISVGKYIHTARMTRRTIAEDPNWSLALVPCLTHFCLKSVVKNFDVLSGNFSFDQLEPDQRAFVEKELSPSWPLHLTAHTVPDGVYWMRCCQLRWSLCDVSLYGESWKRMFFERHLKEVIELFVPGSTDPTTLSELILLCSDYVKKLEISQLLPPIKEPEDEDEDEDEDQDEVEEDGSDLELENEEEKPCFHHLDFSILLDKLENLEELHLKYAVKNCGMNFEWAMFQMTDQDCKNLAKALESCKTLKVFKLRDSHVNDRQCRQLVKALLDHPSLRELDLAYNVIGDSGARAICKLLLSTNSKLETLNLCFNKITCQGAKPIAHALSKNSTLLSINMRLNHLGDEGGQAFGKALLKNKTLLELNLGSTGLTSPTALTLSEALEQNTTLRKINLSCNKLGEGGQAFGKTLLNNKTLLELDLGATGLTTSTASPLSDALEHNTTLRKINLSCNKLGQVGGKALECAMAKNSSIIECDLQMTEVDQKFLSCINRKVIHNQI
uniref:T-complex-associated-testis-expressed 1 n=1 Tax=Gouania willdenowi TaxID=441366 RepID=A0A8C5HPG3_GOUWI